MKAVSAEERKTLKLSEPCMALKVVHVGEYSPHDQAKKAGFKKGDIIVSFDDRIDLARETDLLAYALNKIEPDTEVPVTVIRDGEKLQFSLPISR